MNSESRKKQLILTAIDIIDELGYQNLTIQELSKREKISDAAIYRHFNGKNDLILHVLDYYNHFFTEIYSSIEESKLSASDALDLSITKILAVFEEYPNMTAILNTFENFRHGDEISNRLTIILNGIKDFLTRLFQKGIDNMEFSGKVSASSSAHILMGTFLSVSLTWRLSNFHFSLTDRFLEIIQEVKSMIS